MPIEAISGQGASGAAPGPAASTATPKASGAQPVNTASTQSGGSSGNVQNQPNFDSRIWQLSWPMQSAGSVQGLSRGFMTWAANYPGWGAGGGARPTVFFLYNPTTVTADYAVDASSSSSTVVFASPNDPARQLFGMNESVSFSLLFDRTFELWGASSVTAPGQALTGSNNPGVVGVMADVYAMQQLTGQFFAQAGSAPGSQDIKQGPVVLIPTYLTLGGALGSGQTYYGYVSEFTVTYTHWTQFMVPMRCTIAVSFTLLIPPTSAQLTASGASGTIATISQIMNSSQFQGWTNQQLGTNPAHVTTP